MPDFLHLQYNSLLEFPLFPFCHLWEERWDMCTPSHRLLDPFLQELSAFDPDRAAGLSHNYLPKPRFPNWTVRFRFCGFFLWMSLTGLEPKANLGRTQTSAENLLEFMQMQRSFWLYMDQIAHAVMDLVQLFGKLLHQLTPWGPADFSSLSFCTLQCWKLPHGQPSPLAFFSFFLYIQAL